MGQQLLTYSSVAPGTMIIAEYTKFMRNLTSITSQCLKKLLENLTNKRKLGLRIVQQHPQTAIFMGCNNGEIEICFCNDTQLQTAKRIVSPSVK